MALGAFLSTGGRISAWSVFLVTWLANVGSGILVYVMARKYGRPFFHGRLGRRLLRPEALSRVERLYRRFGAPAIVLSRFIPGVRAVVPPFAGVAGLGAVQTILPIALASAAWYGTITLLATTAVRNAEGIARLLRSLNRTGIIVGSVVVLVVGVVLLRRRRRVPPPQPPPPPA